MAGAIAIGSIFLMLGIAREVSPIAAVTAPQSFLKTLVILKNDRTMILFTLRLPAQHAGARAFHPVPVAIPAGHPHPTTDAWTPWPPCSPATQSR
jgi:hypothetical protein